MPIWLRKFYIQKLVETKKEERKVKETPPTSTRNLHRPGVTPNIPKKS